ncbi:MAG: primosomal protein N' (replication factor Y) - superfamily II helicase [Bryobacterales bacterium]|nr:primosomal protein N' (replication factor Y) - superfamily II helicase [Bryobacterales bacterium]
MTPEVHRYKCPGCSAGMEFDPATDGLKCAYCGYTQKISHPVSAAVEELPLEEFLQAGRGQRLVKLSQQSVEVTCSTCGSTVQFQPPEVAGVCPFCASAIVAQAKSADPEIAPNGVLPFALEKRDATARIREWLSSRWFAPDALKNLARPEGIHGVYVPFWTYDAQTWSRYAGQRGDYYYTTEYVNVQNARGEMERQARQVRHTRWSPVSGRVANSFDDVLIPASRAIDERRLRELAPWDLDAVAAYDPAYLPGFKAQRYQVELADGFAAAKNIMNTSIHHSVVGAIGGDEQRVEGIDTEWNALTFKHVLLPVWIGAYRFSEKVFQVTVNARTGEVQGERPYSAGKIALAVVAALVVILVVVWLANQQ